MDKLDKEIVVCIATYLDARSQAKFAMTSSHNYKTMSVERLSLIWWRLRRAYVSSPIYKDLRPNAKPLEYWNSFVLQKDKKSWEFVDYKYAFYSSISENVILDSKVVMYAASLEPCEYWSSMDCIFELLRSG